MSALVEALSDLPMFGAATIFLQGKPNNDLSAKTTVSYVPDGWVVHNEMVPEPLWVSSLRSLLVAKDNPLSTDPDDVGF